MTQIVTVREAAASLDVALSTIHKRCRLVDLPKTTRKDGQTEIDLDELEKRWKAHVEAADANRRQRTARYTKWLNVPVEQDMLDELDAIADDRTVSRSEAARLLIAEGLHAFYSNGRKFHDA